jgi:iron complex outermembrane receptor protein
MAMLCGATTAFAQEAAPQQAQPAETNSNATPEIVVTAQFRSQKLQDTPLAITAVNAAMLEARSQTSVEQVAAQAPNVTLTPQGQQNGSGLIAFIRGVGQTDFNFALEPGVGIYVDDVYIPTLTGSLLDLMDLDRIEVLRGPQGTLSGRNAIGGAIKLFSTKPQGNGKGSVQAAYGSYNRVELRGFFDVALADNLFVRVAGVSKNRDGYVKRLDYGVTHPGSGVAGTNTGNPVLGTLGGQSYAAGKVSLRWLPTDNVEINLAGDYTRDRSEAGASVLLYYNNASKNSNGQPWLPSTIDGSAIAGNCAFVPYGVNSCDTLTGYNRKFVSYASFTDQTPATTQSPYKNFGFNPHQWLDNYGAMGSVDVQLSDNIALKSITAWRHYKSDWAQDVDNSPIANQMLNQTLVNNQWSEELRLTGKLFDGALDFAVGGFYFKRTGTLRARVDLNYAGIDFLHGPDPTPAENKALFANGTWHVTDAFNLTAGIRHSWDKKDYVFYRHNPDGSTIEGPCNFFLGAATAGPTGIGNQPNCLLFGLNASPASFSSKRFDWRIAADYRFSPEVMAYAQVATGYRAGGVNPRPFFGPSSPFNQIKTFAPEKLTSFEAGFKTDLFDRRMRLNISAFYNDYKDIILTLSACPISPCLQPNNVGAAHVKGFEVETTIKPFGGLTLDGSLSYLNFKYTKLDPGNGSLGALTLDMVTPYTPKWKASGGAQYDFENVRGGTLSARFDGSYQSHVYTEAINYDDVAVPAVSGSLATYHATNRIDAFFIGNARLTWKKQGDAPWSISLEVQNLFNKYYYTSLYEQFASPKTVSGAPGLPRTWGVTLKKDF